MSPKQLIVYGDRMLRGFGLSDFIMSTDLHICPGIYFSRDLASIIYGNVMLHPDREVYMLIFLGTNNVSRFDQDINEFNHQFQHFIETLLNFETVRKVFVSTLLARDSDPTVNRRVRAFNAYLMHISMYYSRGGKFFILNSYENLSIPVHGRSIRTQKTFYFREDYVHLNDLGIQSLKKFWAADLHREGIMAAPPSPIKTFPLIRISCPLISAGSSRLEQQPSVHVPRWGSDGAGNVKDEDKKKEKENENEKVFQGPSRYSKYLTVPKVKFEDEAGAVFDRELWDDEASPSQETWV